MRWTKDDYGDAQLELSHMRNERGQLVRMQEPLEGCIEILSGIDPDHCSTLGPIASLQDAMARLDKTRDDLAERIEAIEAGLANMRARA